MENQRARNYPSNADFMALEIAEQLSNSFDLSDDLDIEGDLDTRETDEESGVFVDYMTLEVAQKISALANEDETNIADETSFDSMDELSGKQSSEVTNLVDYMALEIAEQLSDTFVDGEDSFLEEHPSGSDYLTQSESEDQGDGFLDYMALEVAQQHGAASEDERLFDTDDSRLLQIDDLGTELEDDDSDAYDDFMAIEVKQQISDQDDWANDTDDALTHMEVEIAGNYSPTHTNEAKPFRGLTIARRINFLSFLPALALASLGAMSLYSSQKSSNTLVELDQLSSVINSGDALVDQIQTDLTLNLFQVQSGATGWDKGLQTLDRFEEDIATLYFPSHFQQNEKTVEPANHELRTNTEGTETNLLQGSGASEATSTQAHSAVENLETYIDTSLLNNIFNKSKGILSRQNSSQLEAYLRTEFPSNTFTLVQGLKNEIGKESLRRDVLRTTSRSRNSLFSSAVIIVALLGALLTYLLGKAIYRSINHPIARLSTTMNEISQGNTGARSNLVGDNELTRLGDNLDEMLDERLSVQNQISAESDQINDSVFTLLETVAELAERNLTVRAAVTEDVTGPLADAINQLAEETGDVLKKVRKIATSVEAASQLVNRSALSANRLSLQEQEEAKATAGQLEDILKRLNSVAESAGQANSLAETTSTATQNAQKTVFSALENMNSVRENVQETGKRLKRLGERSQEISQIIDVINNLSERTTVLALNASMQAASAGEAGRGFSIIAEEIQRLSESSRESTDKISSLISNIQQEANTTIANMDTTIEQVLDGSTLAEDAAQQMRDTLNATNQLVDSVEQIAEASAEQAKISKTLQARADRIIESTQSTGKELNSLTNLTRKMADFGKQLVRSVNVFKLET